MSTRTSVICNLLLLLCAPLVQASCSAQLGDLGSTPTSVELRVSVRHPGTARFRIIDNGAALQAGDELHINLTAGELTYAYIFHRGSAGEWRLIFPNPAESGDPNATNPILPGEVCSIPGVNSRLVVDGVSGTEDLVVYALPHPDRAVIDDLVVRLRRGEHPRIQLAGAPADLAASTGPRNHAPAADAADSSGLVLVPLRDLTFVPSGASGVANLPANFAVHLTYHNAGAPPASRQP
jgi:hypothetical protein